MISIEKLAEINGKIELTFKERITALEKFRDQSNVEILLTKQIDQEKKEVESQRIEDLLEEIKALQENVDRKEYLL